MLVRNLVFSLVVSSYLCITLEIFEDAQLINLAVASEHGKIQLFSLQNGTQVASPLADAQYTEPISCVRFDSSEGADICGSQAPSLMVSSKATVDEWAW